MEEGFEMNLMVSTLTPQLLNYLAMQISPNHAWFVDGIIKAMIHAAPDDEAVRLAEENFRLKEMNQGNQEEKWLLRDPWRVHRKNLIG